MSDSDGRNQPQETMQPEMPTRRKTSLVWLGSAIALVAVLVVAIVVTRIVISDETMDVPVGVYVCGSPIDLETVTLGEEPGGCRFVPAPIDMTLEGPGGDTTSGSVSRSSGFGFHDLRKGSYDATLTVRGAIESTTIGVVAIDSRGNRWSGEMTTQTDATGQTEWTFPCRIESDLERMSFYFITSPIIPGNTA